MSEQPKLVLYHFPGACSQVAICALEEAGLDYHLELIDLASGEQGSGEYLAVNPLGKVPYLLIDGEGLAENMAILSYVALLNPDVPVLPNGSDPRAWAEAIGGMSFCSGTLHPAVRGLANPQRLTTGGLEPVRERATELLNKALAVANRRIAEKGWWLGDWSIVDVYLHWALSVAIRAGFDTSPYPALEQLSVHLAHRRSFARMLEINDEARLAMTSRANA